jgi:hypothetical protein
MVTVRTGKHILTILIALLITSGLQSTHSQDLKLTPQFSNPTKITNPFFPLSAMNHTISLGKKENTNIRIEVTPLAQNRIIEWAGGQIEAVVAQFVEYADGRLIEVAYDYFAQSDDGSVYYLGEDVTNYENGGIVNHEGSWLTGRDGAPPALIMPAKPEVGQVFNSENLPGVVYETDKVLSLTEATTTPSGPITDGLLIEETLMDGSIEYKVYAAGFGIVEERDGVERVNLALFTKSESAQGIVPDALQTIEAQAEDIIDIVPSKNWTQIASDITTIDKAWQNYQSSVSVDMGPQAFQDAFVAALTRLKETSTAKNTKGTLQSANDLSAAVVDLFSEYNPAIPIDLGWLDVIERQTVQDATANHLSAAADNIAKANTIWVRLRSSVLAHKGTKVALEFEANLYSQRTALVAKNASNLLENANSALEIVDSLERLY